MELAIDAIYPRDEEHRYRLYARRGRGDLQVLACASDAASLGLALVTLDEDEAEHGRHLYDNGAIGVLDVIKRRWIVLPWHRPEEVTRMQGREIDL
jgi:hypothetical protein